MVQEAEVLHDLLAMLAVYRRFWKRVPSCAENSKETPTECQCAAGLRWKIPMIGKAQWSVVIAIRSILRMSPGF